MKEINQDLHVQAVTFATHHPEDLAGFYQQALNIPVAKGLGGSKDHLAIELDTMYLGFDRIKEEAKPGKGGMVVWFYVENVVEVFQNFIDHGAKVRSNVNTEDRPGHALAVLYDPDGNMVGLIGPSMPGFEVHR